MIKTIPHTMSAAVIDQFGGIEKLQIRTLPVPEIGPDQVLIRIEATGLGAWDVEERAGEYVEYLGAPTFPYVLGWEGAGTVVKAGSAVARFIEGDRVYAVVVPGSAGGRFCAEYAAVNAGDIAPVPPSLTMEQAAAMGWDALTALAGVEGALALEPGETLMVFGASGGVGHLALQIARRAGAHVLAMASGGLHVHVAQAFPLTDIARAHRALEGHYVGKLVLRA